MLDQPLPQPLDLCGVIPADRDEERPMTALEALVCSEGLRERAGLSMLAPCEEHSWPELELQ
ncbi:hypothetical protein [Enhygromyxa salina]|uniref:hypothetical protein n=1 Tax=Enhygromyxa salina TaxID=215803 RepID=UPI0015E62637|nr:hypothetical protein [Enhygromyxa salina]